MSSILRRFEAFDSADTGSLRAFPALVAGKWVLCPEAPFARVPWNVCCLFFDKCLALTLLYGERSSSSCVTCWSAAAAASSSAPESSIASAAFLFCRRFADGASSFFAALSLLLRLSFLLFDLCVEVVRITSSASGVVCSGSSCSRADISTGMLLNIGTELISKPDHGSSSWSAAVGSSSSSLAFTSMSMDTSSSSSSLQPLLDWRSTTGDLVTAARAISDASNKRCLSSASKSIGSFRVQAPLLCSVSSSWACDGQWSTSQALNRTNRLTCSI